MFKRIVSVVITLILSLMFIYFVISVLPGDSTTYMSGESVINVEKQTESLFSFIKKALTLNLGTSAFLSLSVKDLILERLFPTVILSIMSLVIALTISLFFIYLDVIKGKKVLLEAFSSITYSFPSFLIALIALLISSKVFSYFVVYDDENKIISLLIPSLCLGLVHAPFLMKNIRDLIIREKIKPYVTLAYSKGLGNIKVFFYHILLNILNVVIVLVDQSFISLISSSAAVEIIFSIPGIGNLIVQAIARRDSLTIAGVIILIILITSLLSIIEDILDEINKRRTM